MRSASADASMQVPAAAPARDPNTVLKVAGATVALAALAVAAVATSGTAGVQSLSALGAWGAPATPDPFNTFAPQCEPDLRHNSCGAMGELCQCLDLQPGLVEISSRALKSVLDKANVFLLGDSTSKMMVHHACRTLLDPALDPQGAGCFKEDGMPTVYSQPQNLRPLSPSPVLNSPDKKCCEGGQCCMTMLESMVSSTCGKYDANGNFGGIGFVHMASSFKDGFDMPCEYRHAQQLPFTFQDRATESLRQFEKSVSFEDERRAVVILDVNVWMGGTANAKAHYLNIVKMTKNAIRNSGLPIDRTLLMIKTLYDCHDEDQWHCARNNQLIREVSAESGMPLFDFDKLWKEHGLDPQRALRKDGIRQMPDTALFEITSMLDFIARHHEELAITKQPPP